MNSLTDYIYDVFISYKCSGPGKIWVEKYFYPELKEWLPFELKPGHYPKIFFDNNIRVGKKWPKEILEALKGSKILLPIFSPPYFASAWCKAELYTFIRREQYLNLNRIELSKGLIYPLLISDGNHIVEDVKNIKYLDMKEFIYTSDAFKRCRKYIKYQDKLKKIVEDIASMLYSVPDFKDNWPIEEPEQDSKPQTFLFSGFKQGIQT